MAKKKKGGEQIPPSPPGGDAPIPEKGFDFFLDPIETTPVEPTARSLAVGNWGYDAIIGQYGSEIARRAGRQVRAYIFDTAGRYDHPWLMAGADNANGRSFTGETDWADGNGHSTHVASTYVGRHPDGLNIGLWTSLVDANMAKVVPIKVLTNGGAGAFSYIDQALDAILPEVKELIAKGVFVIYNFSLGGGTSVIPTTEERLAKAKAAGVFIAAASGNEGREGVIFPAIGPSSNAVGAVTSSLTKAAFSNTGPKLFMAAPGQGIFGAWIPDIGREASGTSMATPHIGAWAGIAAAIWPNATPAQIATHVRRCVRDLGDPGRDSLYGYGFPNMDALINTAPGEEQPEDPIPDPPKPGRVMTFSVDKWYTVTYSIPNDPVRRTIKFRPTIAYTHRMETKKAAKTLEAIVDNHFRARGYGLLAGNDDWEAAYWIAYFFELIEGKTNAVDVVSMEVDYQGTRLIRTQFNTPTVAMRGTKTIQRGKVTEY